MHLPISWSRARLPHALLASVLALVLAPGCGGAAPPPAASATAEVAAPYPFTVYEIRAGCPLGRVVEYRIEKAGAPARVERWAFAPLDPETVSVTTTAFDDEGKPEGPPTTQTAKWSELHEHARFPQAATQIYNESLTVPAGTFDVMRYVVSRRDKAGASEVATYWFARTLPGPPIKVEITREGRAVMTMTMQANRTH